MSKKMTYEAFKRIYDQPVRVGTNGISSKSNVYRGFGMETLMKSGDNITFWQTRPNPKQLAKYVYITTIAQLMKCGDLRLDPMEAHQGGSRGVSLALFHKTQLPGSVVEKVEIMLGQTEDGHKIVNMTNVRRHLDGVPIGPIDYPRWTSLDGVVHFTDETPEHIGMLLGSGGILN